MENEKLNEQAGIKLSSKDWHYRYMNWFWTDSLAPNKNNMFNLCPYFWMLAATLLASPFVLPFRAFWNVIYRVSELIDKYIAEPILNSSVGHWFDNLTDTEMYMITDTDYHSSKRLKYMRRSLTNMGVSIKDDEGFYLDEYDIVKLFSMRWFLKKQILSDASNNNNWEDDESYQKWVNKIRKERNALKAAKYEKKEKFEKSLDNFRNSVGDSATGVRDYILSLSSIILWTKRVVGLIITIVLSGVSFIGITFASKGILAIVANTSLNQVLVVSIFVLAMAILLGIINGIVKLLELSNKYGWKDYWWGQLFMYTIGYPAYYIGYLPGKIVLYYFVWELILKNLYYGFKAIVIGLKNGFIEFGGIFGQYFGSTKGDYCPGIEWDEDESDIAHGDEL